MTPIILNTIAAGALIIMSATPSVPREWHLVSTVILAVGATFALMIQLSPKALEYLATRLLVRARVAKAVRQIEESARVVDLVEEESNARNHAC